MAARLILSGSKDKNHRWTAMKDREPTRRPQRQGLLAGAF